MCCCYLPHIHCLFPVCQLSPAYSMSLTQFPLVKDVLKMIQIDTKHLFSIHILYCKLSKKKPIPFWERTLDTVEKHMHMIKKKKLNTPEQLRYGREFKTFYFNSLNFLNSIYIISPE